MEEEIDNKDRLKLPYRKNCEGYFFFEDKVLAQDTKKGMYCFLVADLVIAKMMKKQL